LIADLIFVFIESAPFAPVFNGSLGLQTSSELRRNCYLGSQVSYVGTVYFIRDYDKVDFESVFSIILFIFV